MNHAALIGLGTMGPGIAATLARAGWQVRAYDLDAGALQRGPAAVAQADQILDRLARPVAEPAGAVTFHADLPAACAGATLVIENVPENLALKRQVLAAIEALVTADCILATDSSGIPITALQSVLADPGRMVGMHWSNPPHIIPMIEVIGGEQTRPAIVEGMMAIVRDLGLLPVRIRRDVPGFVENRILYAVMREALDLVENGVIEPEALDICVSWGIGFKLAVIGPMALLDMAGLDIYGAVGGYLNQELSSRRDVSAVVTERIAAGRLGLKSGGGIYDYAPEAIPALRAARAARLVAVRRALEADGTAPGSAGAV